MNALVALLCAALPCSPSFAGPDLVSVRDHGAVGDGEADDTQAFVSALAAARETGAHVYVPRGRYRVSQPLDVENLAVRGPAAGAWPADVDALPSILPTHTDGSVFRLGAGGALHGLDITCRLPGDAESGPPAVLISGIGCYISNFRIRYPWDGIVTDGINNVGRLNIENVFIVSPRNTGVRVTGTWDVPRLNNVEVWNAGPVQRGLTRGIGFHLGKNDLIRLTDCFVFAMRYGFLLEDHIEGSEIEGGTWGVMTGCSTDFCGVGIAVRGDHTVSISGGTFWNHAQSLIVEGEGARVRLTGAELKSNGTTCVEVRDCDHTLVTSCSLLRPMEEYVAPAVVVERGRAVISHNVVDGFGPALRVGPQVRFAIFRGNLVHTHGHPAVVDECPDPARLLVEANLFEEPPQ